MVVSVVELRRRRFVSRVFNAPRMFLKFYRIVRGLPTLERIRFAAWQTWASVRGF